MKKKYVGVDISKDTFDVCILDEMQQIILKNLVFENNKKGCKSFVAHLTKSGIKQNAWVCMEHTGVYGELLASTLIEEGIILSLVNPFVIKQSAGFSRGKTDRVDAFRIASYASIFREQLVPYKLPNTDLQLLKALMTQYDLDTKVSVKYKNNLKALHIKNKTVDVSLEISRSERKILFIKDDLKELKARIKEVIERNKDIKVNFDKINKVCGVGPITATKCLVETQNFTRFQNGRQFNCHCGLAPFQHQSGTSVKGKTRTNKHCNKSMKSILFKAASTAIQHDPQLKHYYRRKVTEGKHKLSALNAVAAKVVLRIFAAANRDQPFVKLAH